MILATSGGMVFVRPTKIKLIIVHHSYHNYGHIRRNGVCPPHKKEPNGQWQKLHIHSDQVASYSLLQLFK